MYDSPAGPDAARTSPSHRMPIEPSFEADGRESPPLFDGSDVLVRCPGQKAIIEAVESFAGWDQTDFEVREHPADCKSKAANIVGKVLRIHGGREQLVGELYHQTDIG